MLHKKIGTAYIIERFSPAERAGTWWGMFGEPGNSSTLSGKRLHYFVTEFLKGIHSDDIVGDPFFCKMERKTHFEQNFNPNLFVCFISLHGENFKELHSNRKLKINQHSRHAAEAFPRLEQIWQKEGEGRKTFHFSPAETLGHFIGFIKTLCQHSTLSFLCTHTHTHTQKKPQQTQWQCNRCPKSCLGCDNSDHPPWEPFWSLHSSVGRPTHKKKMRKNHPSRVLKQCFTLRSTGFAGIDRFFLQIFSRSFTLFWYGSWNCFCGTFISHTFAFMLRSHQGQSCVRWRFLNLNILQ